MPDPQIIFNPTVGKYDVESDVGPSYGTQRQEAANAFTQILANNPQAFAVVGDFWAQYQDFPGADELAERLKKGLPPQYQGPNPQVMQVQQAAQQHAQMAQGLLKQADAEIARLQAHNVRLKEQAADKQSELVVDEYKAETDRMKAVGSIDPLALQMIVRKMVAEMLHTDMVPAIAHHGMMEQALQGNVQAAQPQQPTNGNGTNGSGQGPGQAGQQAPVQ
jgi:hypothetical protein